MSPHPFEVVFELSLSIYAKSLKYSKELHKEMVLLDSNLSEFTIVEMNAELKNSYKNFVHNLLLGKNL